ncbi:MAG: hypothetical protein AB4080_23255 [Trichodesmium sp.]
MLTFSARSSKKLVLFPEIKLLKPLSLNAFIFNQQALSRVRAESYTTSFNYNYSTGHDIISNSHFIGIIDAPYGFGLQTLYKLGIFTNIDNITIFSNLVDWIEE